MDVAIRELETAELDIVAGAGPSAWDFAKLWAGAGGSLIGGPILMALAASAVMGIQAAHQNPYVPNCEGGTGGCDSNTMQD